MRMKGIHPMIAAILLIAFTIAIGGIISVWLGGVVQRTGGEVETHAEALVRCQRSGFEILSARPATNNVIITQYGAGLKIYPTIVRFPDGTVNTTFTASPAVLDAPAKTSTLTVTFPAGATSVKVIALCEYGLVNITVEASCAREEACWAK